MAISTSIPFHVLILVMAGKPESPRSTDTALHCTALHCTALHCNRHCMILLLTSRVTQAVQITLEQRGGKNVKRPFRIKWGHTDSLQSAVLELSANSSFSRIGLLNRAGGLYHLYYDYYNHND
jgi:hypothetical protein